MITWPNDLIEDIARRKCVLVLGAGVSKNSSNAAGGRPKDWKEFLTTACASVKGKTEIRKQIASGDYLTACELIKKALGRDDFNTLVKQEYLTPKFNPAEIHKYIYELDSRIVITPNFDKIYDTYANTTSAGSVIVKKYYETDIADCIRRPERLIIKIHGSVESTDSLIFTRKDYAEKRTKNADFYDILHALSLTHTFIFIGCGTNDPDIRLIFEDYNFKYKLNKRHFIIMPSTAVHKDVFLLIEDTMSLKPLTYDSKNYHIQLTESLKALSELVYIKRGELSVNLNW